MTFGTSTLRRLPGLTPRGAALVIGVAGAALLVGAASAAKGVAVPGGMILLVCGAFALRQFGWAFALTALVAGAVDAIPFVDSTRTIATGIQIDDLSGGMLVACFAVLALPHAGPALRSLYVRAICGVAGLFFAWWLIVTLHTISGGTPMLQVVRTGRDFMIFALLTPLAVITLSSDRRLRQRLLVGLAITIAVATTIRIIAMVALPSLVGTIVFTFRHFLVGMPRLDGGTDDLAGAVLAFAVAYLALYRGADAGRHHRRLASAAILALTVLFLLLIQTRARYVTVPLGVGALLLTARGTTAATLKIAVGLAVVASVAGAAISVVHDPQIDRAVSSVSSRISATGDTGSGSVSTDTVAYRKNIAAIMGRRLSRENAWATGLGFLSATSSPDPELPQGSIRNPDVGVLNSVMTMGLVGTVLIYALAGLAALIALIGLRREGPDHWLAGGAFAYLVTSIGASITLGAFFSVPGCVTSAIVIAVGVSVTADGRGCAASASSAKRRGRLATRARALT